MNMIQERPSVVVHPMVTILRTSVLRLLRQSAMLCATLSCLVPTYFVSAAEYDQLVFFGDSDSDVGNTHVPDHYFEGRHSNGPNWLDHLASAFELPHPSASKDGGMGFAIASASTGSVRPNLPPSMDRQVEDYLQHHVPSNQDLFVLFGGFLDFAYGQTNAAKPVEHVSNQIQQIIDAGGRHFLVGSNTTASFGVGSESARIEFNTLLPAELEKIQDANPDTSIHWLDYGVFLDSVFTEPAKYGISNITDPACSNCGFGQELSVAPIIAPNSEEFFFWDNAHLTTTAHKLLAESAFCELSTSSTFNDCNFVGGLQTIRHDTHWDDTNVAAQGTALQSSDHGDRFLAANATDGVNNTIACTSSDATEHWWQVDLGTQTVLNEITIENGGRKGRYFTDGGGIRTEVLSTDGTVVWQQDVLGGDSDQLNIDLPQSSIEGQVVRLSKLDPVKSGSAGAFRLREVSVIADMPTYEMESSDTWLFDIDADTNSSDTLGIAGKLALNDSHLYVASVNGELSVGDEFNLLDFESLEGQFESLLLPELDETLQWHTGNLYLDGTIAVTHRGDFDNSQTLDGADIDLIVSRNGTNSETEFDLNYDGVIDDADREYWITELAGTRMGDANLDQKVDFADFVVLSAAYQTAAGWANGDFDGDGRVEFADFLILSSHFDTTAQAAASVPEPASSVLLVCTVVGVMFVRKRRWVQRAIH